MTTDPSRPALLDVNVLLALSWDQHVHHAAAHAQFGKLIGWRTSPVTEAGLVRLLLTEAVVGRKVTGQEALGQLKALRGVPGWGWLEDDQSLAVPIVDLRVLMGRRQVTDLQLVNTAAAHGAVLATFDAGLRDSLAPADRQWVEVW
ncbi:MULTISPECIES: TA system VapC family ribonuclease toxin [Brevibacterium]|uniref:Ribonuclease VapC n=1 Tax=Brevibacterium salitolerans TaxID=1403566 RepID=A0ABN2W9E3_9MICO|nr:TA system VapC family ribonuclease toxin [Brevibacterium sp.]